MLNAGLKSRTHAVCRLEVNQITIYQENMVKILDFNQMRLKLAVLIMVTRYIQRVEMD